MRVALRGRSVSRHTRFLLAIGGVALFAAAILPIALLMTRPEQLELLRAGKQQTALRGTVLLLVDAIHDQESALDDFLLSGAPAAIDRFEAAVLAEEDATTRIGEGAVDLSGVVAAVDAVVQGNDVWLGAFARPAIAAVRSGDPTALEPFLSIVTGGHEPVESLLDGVSGALAAVDVQVDAREAALAATRTLSTAVALLLALAAASLALLLTNRYGRELERAAHHAGILNRFTEAASFAPDDQAVAGLNMTALKLLVGPDAGVVHVFNRSKDRGVPEALFGEIAGETLALSALSRCSGLIRGGMYISDDLASPLSVRCPILPRTSGTLACIPLNSGETVGTVHLYWQAPGSLPLVQRADVLRLAENAALSIGNRRLLAVLQGQANSDPRTGLANSRAFDLALELAMAARIAGESNSILLLDIDHFKEFNDRHGHPAGDEALRVFAAILRSCLRDGDMAARYGGDEFAVLLAGADEGTAVAIAERIRARVESTVIPLGPGLTDRITISVGRAMDPANGTERVSLMRSADLALYRAKEAGRNRVVATDDPVPVIAVPSMAGRRRESLLSTQR